MCYTKLCQTEKTVSDRIMPNHIVTIICVTGQEVQGWEWITG